jgi:hypothetical protein
MTHDDDFLAGAMGKVLRTIQADEAEPDMDAYVADFLADRDGTVRKVKAKPAPKAPPPEEPPKAGVFSRRGLGPDLSKLVGRSAELLRDADAVAAMPTEEVEWEDEEDEDAEAFEAGEEEAAPKAAPPKAEPKRIVLSPSDPMNNARKFMQECCMWRAPGAAEGVITLWRWQHQFWKWNGRVYVPDDKDDARLESELWKFFDGAKRRVMVKTDDGEDEAKPQYEPFRPEPRHISCVS